MEYAVSILTTLTFVLVYFLVKPKEREHFTKKLTDDEFVSAMEKLANNDYLPNKNGKKEYSINMFLRKIKYVNFIAKRYINKENTRSKKLFIPEIQTFCDVVDENFLFLKKISKIDFSKLDDLPAYKNGVRIEKICRALLEHNNFSISTDRVCQCFEIFNEKLTVTFPEMQNFHLMAKFLLLEKLYFVALRIETLIKAGHYAQKATSHPNFYEKRKFYNQVKTNNVFLHFTSSIKRIDCPSADLVYLDVTHNISNLTQTIFNELKSVDELDFVKFYTPMKILENYENFQTAPGEVKLAFLTELSNQSTAQNIDETAYTYSLQKYSNRAESRSFRCKNINFVSSNFCFSHFKPNMTTLYLALSSSFAMNMIFGSRADKSILRNNVFKNTLSTFQPKNTVKLGISVKNEKLTINPVLPQNIYKVDLFFQENGLQHVVHIEKSKERELFCNGTKYEGIPAIKLGDKPLEIFLKVPNDDM